MENGKFVEHWDVIEPILPPEEWKNTNGKLIYVTTIYFLFLISFELS